jgi:CheY-like chemotaxis protein
MRRPGSPAEGPGAPRLPLVLAIDDDPAILNAVRRTLRGLPIRLLCLGSAEEALEVIRIQAPAVIVSDHRLPGISGIDLLVEVRSRWPQMGTLLHTGDSMAGERAAQLRLAVLEKGAPPHALRATVRSLLGGDPSDGTR